MWRRRAGETRKFGDDNVMSAVRKLSLKHARPNNSDAPRLRLRYKDKHTQTERSWSGFRLCVHMTGYNRHSSCRTECGESGIMATTCTRANIRLFFVNSYDTVRRTTYGIHEPSNASDKHSVKRSDHIVHCYASTSDRELRQKKWLRARTTPLLHSTSPSLQH